MTPSIEANHSSYRWRRYCLPAVFAFSLMSGTSAVASEPVKPPSVDTSHSTVININDRVVISASGGLGILHGSSKEMVFSPTNGRKISELTWSLDNIMLLEVGMTARLNALLTLNASFASSITDSSSMDDYDWRLDSPAWTDWSQHDDTTLDSGTMFDINAEVAVFKHQTSTFFATIGFKRDNWEWSSRGGSYIYSVNSFRDTSGSFPPGQDIISYEQWFNVPYLGAGFHTRANAFSFSGRIIGSPLVDAGDTDYHYLRNLRYEGDFSNGSMIGINLNGSYRWNEHLAFTLGFDYQNYSENKGNLIITDLSTGAQSKAPDDTAGISHSSSTVSLGGIYTF